MGMQAIKKLLGINNNDNGFDSSQVVANADGSVLERLEHIAAGLEGTAGIATYPAGAAPANGVSVAEVTRDAWDALRNGTGGSEPGTNKSILDAIGFDGVAAIASSAGMLRTMAGTQFVLKVSVTSSAIPNNTQTSGAFTGAASGDILIEDIILQTNSTGIAGPTNLEITTDNVKGLTGAAAPSILQAVSALGANKTVVCRVTSTTKAIPLLLESGKKLFIDGDDGAGTGAGTMDIILVCRRVTDGGSLAAGGIGS